MINTNKHHINNINKIKKYNNWAIKVNKTINSIPTNLTQITQ